jgi:hypothetical protein
MTVMGFPERRAPGIGKAKLCCELETVAVGKAGLLPSLRASSLTFNLS